MAQMVEGMMNVKTGDLAIITSTCHAGAIVEVLDFYGGWREFKDLWHVKPARPLEDIYGKMSGDGYVRDAVMRPVSGLSDEDVSERQLEHVQ